MDIDYILIKKMYRGDDDAFDRFIGKYYEDILRYCVYHCNGDPEDAKDLTQNTFLRFFEEFPTYEHRGKAKNFLYTIARNLCIDHKRRLGRTQTEVFDEGLMYGNSVVTFTDREAEEIHECLSKVAEEYREVMILYYFQQLKQREIAKLLGIGLPLVKYRLRKGKEEMRKEWSKGGHNEF